MIFKLYDARYWYAVNSLWSQVHYKVSSQSHFKISHTCKDSSSCYNLTEVLFTHVCDILNVLILYWDIYKNIKISSSDIKSRYINIKIICDWSRVCKFSK